MLIFGCGLPGREVGRTAEYLLHHPGVALLLEGLYGLIVKVHVEGVVDMLDPDRLILFREIVDRCVVPGALARRDPL